MIYTLFVWSRRLRLVAKRVFVCSWRKHRFKFGPSCCIRCGKPLPTIKFL